MNASQAALAFVIGFVLIALSGCLGTRFAQYQPEWCESVPKEICR